MTIHQTYVRRTWFLAIALGGAVMSLAFWFTRPAAVAGGAAPVLTKSNLASQFHGERTGGLHGRVTWTGEIPIATPIPVRANLSTLDRIPKSETVLNPFSPRIDSDTLGIADALVTLTNVDPERAKPWSHAPVRVMLDKNAMTVFQGGQEVRVGIVRKGDSVTFENPAGPLLAVTARGANFFTLPLPEAGSTVTRTMNHDGWTELRGGSNVYWLGAHLFVSEHGYVARTDRQGRWELRDVPAGDYFMETWLANWNPERVDLDPDWHVPTRHIYRPAGKLRQRLTVNVGETTERQSQFSASDFIAEKN